MTLTRTLLVGLALAPLCLLAPSAPAVDAAADDGNISGEIHVKRGDKDVSDRSNVVVYIEGVPATERDTKGKHAIRQKDLQFSPRISVVVKGSTIDFPNDDKVFHNVFSASRPARFDLGLYRSGASKSVEFKREGVVDVFCNIHPEMSSRVLVVPNGHFATTDAAGKFSLEGVPAGTYPIVVWHPSGKETRSTVTVVAGKTAKLDATVEQGDLSTEHRRKDGSPYGRYE